MPTIPSEDAERGAPEGLLAGVARNKITPFPGVDLAGWGYYLERTWETIRDDLCVTALCIERAGQSIALVTLDLMTIGSDFVRRVREGVAQRTDIPMGNILLTASHSHNAPTAGELLGVGSEHADYVNQVVETTVDAVAEAWQSRVPAQVSSDSARCAGLTFNRTRENGPVDDCLTVLCVNSRPDSETVSATPLAVVVNYQAHPTVLTELFPRAVSRDVPGQVVDLIETALPGATALYVQGACGDVNFHREFQTLQRCGEPAAALAQSALRILDNLSPFSNDSVVRAEQRMVQLPCRRWTTAELSADRDEAAERLAAKRLEGWRDTIGRVMVNRPDDMVHRHQGDEWRAVEAMCRFQMEWTSRMQEKMDAEERAGTASLGDQDVNQPAEVQCLRIGGLAIVANPTEFFTTLALDVRSRSMADQVMIGAYSNGRIGYLPDAHDVERRTYAAYQSPKYCTQHPFTAESGGVMCDAMVDSIARVFEPNL